MLTVSDNTQVDIIAHQFDAWLMVGAEGAATGTVAISDSSVLIDGGRNAGMRLGTSWFDSVDQTGTGALTIEDGSDVTIRSGGDVAQFFVGGGAGSDAQAIIRDSTVTMEGGVQRLVLVGASPDFVFGTGGQGEMHIEGADARLNGVGVMVVGGNAGTGQLTMVDGARIAMDGEGGGWGNNAFLGVGIGRVRADEPHTHGSGEMLLEGSDTRIDITADDAARLFVGTNVGTGHAILRDGAQIALDGAVSVLHLGTDSGTGWLDLVGADTRIDLTGDDARIRIGQLIDPEASIASAARGVLRIDEGATVRADTMVEVGDASDSAASLVMAGGELVTPLVELAAGATPLNNMLLGHGRIIGIADADAPALLLAGSSVYVGDDLHAEPDITGAYLQQTGTGLMEITGNVVAQDSFIYFDIGAAGGGYDQIDVTGSFVMEGGRVQVSALEGAQALLEGGGVRLIAASGGIAMDEVDLLFGTLPDGTVIEADFRDANTELWAVLEGSGGPDPDIPLPPLWRDWLIWIGGGGGAPPPAPAVGRGDIVADPHLITLDGLAYDFHAVGEFVLLRETGGNGFEVQARMAPVGGNASENVAAAVRLDGGAVMVDATTPGSVLVNGIAVALDPGQSHAVGDDLILRTGDTWHLIHRHGDPEGDTISTASIAVVDGRLDISVYADNSLAGQVEGLLGNFDGDPDSDLSLPDGTLVSRPLVFGDDADAGVVGLYGVFRDAWRISESEHSLFTYAPGEGPDSFYLPDYPARMVTLDDFDTEEIAAATAIVTAAGLEEGTVAFSNALFDLLVTGNDSYVDSAVTFRTQQDARPEDAPVPVAPPVEGGGLEGLLTLGGQVTGVDAEGLSGVRVSLRPEGRTAAHLRDSDAEGAFTFEVLPMDAGGRLEASRPVDPVADGRPTVFDALDVLRLAVGLQPSFGPATPEAFIAADMDGNGQVDVFDALEVLRAAVGLDSPNAPRWVFIDSEADLQHITRVNVEYETGISVGAMTQDLDVSMTGILLGAMQEFA